MCLRTVVRHMSEAISILHVDDEPEVLELSTRLFERRDTRISVTTADSGSDGLAALEERRVDCIVSDSIRLPDGDSFVEAASRRSDAPIVLFTAKEWDEVAADAVAADVAEYVRKADAADYKEVLRHVLRLTDADAERTSDRRLIGSHDFSSNAELGVSIVRAVQDVAGGDLDEYDPLFDAVDPDALETLLASGADRHDADPDAIEISFTYHGLDLSVRTDGSIMTTSSVN
jgi:DNA-binding NtrC family response regulator